MCVCVWPPCTLQALLHELDKIQGEARAAAARAEAADAEVQAREQLLAAARVSASPGAAMCFKGGGHVLQGGRPCAASTLGSPVSTLGSTHCRGST